MEEAGQEGLKGWVVSLGKKQRYIRFLILVTCSTVHTGAKAKNYVTSPWALASFISCFEVSEGEEACGERAGVLPFG